MRKKIIAAVAIAATAALGWLAVPSAQADSAADGATVRSAEAALKGNVDWCADRGYSLRVVKKAPKHIRASSPHNGSTVVGYKKKDRKAHFTSHCRLTNGHNFYLTYEGSGKPGWIYAERYLRP